MAPCAGCQGPLKKKTFDCKLCKKTDFCRDCCKRYLALEGSAEQVRMCNDCFFKNVAWDSSRTYDVLGPADGQVVVLVHGAIVGRQCMIGEARALAEAGYRVILPDLPAHGSRYKEPLTLDSAIAVLHEVITKEAPGKRVVVAGFSMGGYVTAAYAAAHPEVMAGALLGACAHDTHTRSWRMMGNVADFVYKVCSYKTKSGFITKTAELDPKREDVQECFLRAGAEYDAWHGCWTVMHDADMMKVLPRIACPALLVAGEKDFRSHQDQFQKLLQHGRAVVLANAEHAFTAQPSVSAEWRKLLMTWLSTINWATGEAAAPAAGVEAEVFKPAVASGNAKKTGISSVIEAVWKQRK